MPPDGAATAKPGRFYRPELDAIRFLAFFAIFLFHSPHIHKVEWLEQAGSFGLPLFFFLSAFLITELLLRERKQTDTIHLKAFYIRRSLRIWPLYFLGVFTAILWSHYVERFRISHQQIAYLLLLVLGFLGRDFHFNPAGVLWSISVEEIFYLIWPLAGKLNIFGWACLALLVSATITIIYTGEIWYNPLTQFFYFALGGFLALLIHRIPRKLPMWLRMSLLSMSVGAFLWGSTLSVELLRFILGGAGCILAILALLNIDPKWIPKSFAYLGKISFGLYVFHLSCIVLVTTYIDRQRLGLGVSTRALLIQGIAFVFCTTLAALSYRYFETPFLKLKSRFEFVKSRPI